jgi:hypothetical protein
MTTPADREQRNTAQTKMLDALLRLNHRVSQAADDGYNVTTPDVLSEAMLKVAYAQFAAGEIGYLEQCALMVREYDKQTAALDQKFPRRS